MTVAVSGDSITFPDNSVQATAPKVGMVNRIINGAMVIDQRNAGASVTPTADNTYTLDRWNAKLSQASKYSVQQSSTGTNGFKNSLLVTSLSAYTVGVNENFFVKQVVEGFNCADFGWGAAGAQTVTLSFLVRCSLTGTFGGSLFNSDGSRSYPFTYSIPVANTFTAISVTIAGDTSGTWLTTNGAGVNVGFGLGVGANQSGTAGAWTGSFRPSATGAVSVVGTSGATFYITGVQLEKGSTATSFDYRPYGTELGLCQRYLPVIQNNTGERIIGAALTTTNSQFTVYLQVTPRVPPTGVTATTASNFGTYIPATTGQPTPTAISFATAGVLSASINVAVASGFTAGQFIQFFPNNSSAQILFTGCEL